MKKYISVKDFEEEAKNQFTPFAHDYINTGAHDEASMKANRCGFNLFKLNPRVLVNVSKICTEMTLFGKTMKIPFGIAPTAMNCLVHPDGELNVARAAGKKGTVATISTLSSFSLEEISNASPDTSRWFQMYITKNRKITEKLVALAEKNGYTALVLTVDAPILGKRETPLKNSFSPPSSIRLGNIEMLESELSQSLASGYERLTSFFTHEVDQSMTWDDIAWLSRLSKLPLILKGIQSAEDARIAGIFKL